ncbi:DUF3822 family protein [Bacteroidota bacterium]
MLQFELLDETLDINKTSSLHLSIQVSLDGFLFAVLDPAISKYLCLKRYSFDKTNNPDQQYEEIHKIIHQDPFLQKSYQGVSFIQSETRSTLLPAALFDRNHLKLYFEFNHVLNDLDELHYNYLKQSDAYLVFPVHSEIANLCLKTWMNTKFFHQVTPLINDLISGEAAKEKLAGINFNIDHFDIIVSENRQLIYHNNFRFRSEEDLLYFILFAFDKLGLDQEKTPVLLSGEIDKFSNQPALLKKYFRNLSFLPAPSEFRYPPAFHKIQEHSLLSLLRLYHCE